VLGLARHLLEVLCNAGVAAQLRRTARATALRFTPDAIADRCAQPCKTKGPGPSMRSDRLEVQGRLACQMLSRMVLSLSAPSLNFEMTPSLA